MRSSRRAAQHDLEAFAASRRAVAAPMPLLAPVTTATRSGAWLAQELMGESSHLGIVANARRGMARTDLKRWTLVRRIRLATPTPASRRWKDVRGQLAAHRRRMESRLTPAGPSQSSSRLRRRPPVRRVAMLSLHTSPVEQPGVGDAGGMNVYVMELSRRLAAKGVEVDVFTRARRATSPRSSTSRPASPCATSSPARSSRCRKPICRRNCVRSRPRCCAPRRLAKPVGTTSSTRTTGCRARSGGWRRSAGACRWCTACTRWRG